MKSSFILTGEDYLVFTSVQVCLKTFYRYQQTRESSTNSDAILFCVRNYWYLKPVTIRFLCDQVEFILSWFVNRTSLFNKEYVATPFVHIFVSSTSMSCYPLLTLFGLTSFPISFSIQLNVIISWMTTLFPTRHASVIQVIYSNRPHETGSVCLKSCIFAIIFQRFFQLFASTSTILMIFLFFSFLFRDLSHDISAELPLCICNVDSAAFLSNPSITFHKMHSIFRWNQLN